MNDQKARWIWYPDDLELYHALKQNFSRVERGIGWPAYWKSSGWHQRIALWREYLLQEPTVFTVSARGTGFVRVIEEEPVTAESAAPWNIQEISRKLERKETKYAFGDTITCGPGKVTVVIHVGRIEALPAAFVSGSVICSDEGWLADDYGEAAVPAGSSPYFTEPEQDPAVWDYSERILAPVRTESVPGGTLYEWETELTAELVIDAPEDRLAQMIVNPGESRDEALDPEHCYLHFRPENGRTPCCAVRYAFIPGPPVKVSAVYRFVDFPGAVSFHCDDPLLNRIWDVSAHTFRLCSGIFFTDGIKRDKWIWSGDAYQSFFVNRYLMADPDIERRTLLALRGSDPVTTHINTIVDYSLLWILAVSEHVKSAGDTCFLRRLWPKMKSLMDFCESRLDEDGFIVGQERDWVYIDWAEIDKDGPTAGEQMLLSAAWKTMAELTDHLCQKQKERQFVSANSMYPVRRELSDPEYAAVAAAWKRKSTELAEKIDQYFWSEDAGAYIDSFISGRCHISRQTNILALRTGIADDRQKKLIFANVLKNDSVPAIKTPYFQFYALDALAGLGELDSVMHTLKDYWGGMLDRGAVTFWEEFDPEITGTAQYDMYGDRFGKSLCHAWAASPVYLIARYFVGLRFAEAEGTDFILEPQLRYFGSLECTLPVGMKGGSVSLHTDGRRLTVCSEGVSGILRIGGEEKMIIPGQKTVWNFCV